MPSLYLTEGHGIEIIRKKTVKGITYLYGAITVEFDIELTDGTHMIDYKLIQSKLLSNYYIKNYAKFITNPCCIYSDKNDIPKENKKSHSSKPGIQSFIKKPLSFMRKRHSAKTTS